MKFLTNEQRAEFNATYPNYIAVRSELDEILSQLDASTEGIGLTIVGKIFIAVADTFTGLLHTFKTNTFKFLKTLKRSELREFVESHKLRVGVLDRIEFDKFIGVEVDAPANMNCTYNEAINALIAIYTKLNALNIAKLTETSFVNIQKAITSGAKNTADLINSSAVIIGRTVSAASSSVAKCQSLYTGKNGDKKPFGSLFKNLGEWTNARNALLDQEFRLQEVSKLTESIERMEMVLKGIVSSIEDKDHGLTAREINALADMAKGVALIFDSYALAATRQMALEHNYILIINEIYERAG